MFKKMTDKELNRRSLKISFKKFLVTPFDYNNILHRISNLFTNLTKETSQSILEYFILFTIIAAFTLICLWTSGTAGGGSMGWSKPTVLGNIQGSLSAIQESAINKIVEAEPK
jgi:hypothetical protein